MRRSLILLALAGMLGSTCAAAAGKHPWSFGLRFGDDMDKRLPLAGVGELDTERALGGTFGYFFHEHFGVEVGLTDLGRSERSAIADAGFALEGEMYTLGVVAQTKVADQFSVFGGVGAFRLSEDGQSITIAGRRPFDIDQTGVYVEGGGRYAINDVMYLRASYQWFNFDEDSDGTPWIGAEVHF